MTINENIYILPDTDICLRIGSRIQRLRLRQNLTQSALAHQAQISVSTIKKIENGQIGSFDSLIRVLRVLGELDVLSPLLKEEEMSPNEYYELMNAANKRERKRASKQPTIDKPTFEQEDLQW